MTDNLNETTKEEMIEDLGSLYKLFVAFHDKYKLPPTQFVIDENIIVNDLFSGKPIIYYEPDFYKNR